MAWPDSPIAVQRTALVVGLAVVVVLATLVGWLGFRAYESHETEVRRNLFVQAARQGAVNLTTFDYEHADAEEQRILGSATGSFYANFPQRWQPFLDFVKQSRAALAGTVVEAGLESQTDDAGQVLVAVAVKSTVPGGTEQEAQVWRLRVTVQKMGGEAKLSNVAFVS
ncbi:mammalian cell entry protein [Mycobacterium kyorinense]|uniref:Mammalian cell entry protein n=1 Tax=Mycobacterium kyorinense TaxID=487514 RepID=A0A1A2ZAD0_9MYCO|nr:mammalian cell entry protein [Mycobacterium kyorinense]OBI47609.1 mammalian cell entry protein [Mycobacterium kyorinense]